jgi:signal transduction histidine kinase
MKASRDKGKGYIICVDDDRALLDVLIQQLETGFSDTHEIEGAESAAEALELMNEFYRNGDNVEMVISDQVMPGMKGDQLLERIYKEHPDVITVMLTGQGGLNSAIYAINHAGLSKYLLKPWNNEDLKLTIRDLLEKSRLEKENKRLFLELKEAYQHLKETQEQLIQSEKLAVVGKLTAGIAHEVRNQLTILGYAEVIKMAVPDNKQIAQYVQNILDARNRILSIVEEIRQFAKNQTQSYTKDLFFLTDIVDASLNIMSYDKETKKRTIVKKFQASPMLKLNKDKIIQVLINLVRNAVQATTDAGEITVLVTQNQEQAILQIADNGCGIPSEHLNKIWQPFFTTKGEDGTGLGLEICKRIIEGHHGRISCESEVGVGTTFTVELPLKTSEVGGEDDRHYFL